MMMIGHVLITVPTFVISIALAYATFVQADATRKIQQSETWPFVSYGTSNVTAEGSREISFKLGNNGVGPARLEAMEFLYDGRPMQTPREFLQACCGDRRGSPTAVHELEVRDRCLRPGEKIGFIRLVKSPGKSRNVGQARGTNAGRSRCAPAIARSSTIAG